MSPGVIARVVVIAVVVLTLHPVCDVYFDCGCLPIGFGGVTHCDAMVAGAPDCPWCHGGTFRFVWVGALIAGGVGLGFHLSRGRSPWWLVGGGLLGYAVGSAIASFAAALVGGYPRWLGIAL